MSVTGPIKIPANIPYVYVIAQVMVMPCGQQTPGEVFHFPNPIGHPWNKPVTSPSPDLGCHSGEDVRDTSVDNIIMANQSSNVS